MKLILSGLALALASASSMATAQYYGSMPETDQPKTDQQQQKPDDKQANAPKPSSKAMKAIIELQTAVNANDTANIPAKLAAAQAVATTKEDRYWIARMQLKAAVTANDNVAASAAIDSIAASGVLAGPDLAKLYSGIGGSFFTAKQYDKAATAFEHQLALDPNNSSALINLAESRAAAGQKAEAVTTLEKVIKAGSVGGQKPAEAIYKRAVGLAYDANLPSALDISREWVMAYPSPESWRNTIAIYRNAKKPDTEGTLDLLRLMQAAGAMKMSQDYAIFAESAAEQLNYNEAQAVLDAGIAAKVVDPSDAEIKEALNVLKVKQKATAADLDAALKMSPSGINLLRIGDRYYALGNYAKAAEVYRQSMGKAGVEADVANLHLGMALLRGGDKAGSIAAFNAVTGPRADIAKLWLIYAQQHA